MIAKSFVVFLFLSLAASAAVRTVSDLPPSPYADTEVSSNVVFNATRGDAKFFDVRLELTGTASNNVQIAFGRDADGNGDLALEETGLVLAWRGGRYCVENVPESERIVESSVSETDASRFLHMRVMTDRDLEPRAASFTVLRIPFRFRSRLALSSGLESSQGHASRRRFLFRVVSGRVRVPQVRRQNQVTWTSRR